MTSDLAITVLVNPVAVVFMVVFGAAFLLVRSNVSGFNGSGDGTKVKRLTHLEQDVVVGSKLQNCSDG